MKRLIVPVLLALAGATIALASFLNGPKDARKVVVAGGPTPEMSGRRQELVPGAIPNRVRYMFSPNEVVNRVADILTKGLTSGDANLYADSVWLQPGGWKVLKAKCAICSKDKSKMSVIDPNDLQKGKLEGGLEMKFVRGKDDLAILAKTIAKLLEEDGGFAVRALTTDEMAKWWVYIGFDIEEPVYVAASKGGKYRFILEINDKNTAAIVDELNALPNRPGN